jgi:hypothetical protein
MVKQKSKSKRPEQQQEYAKMRQDFWGSDSGSEDEQQSRAARPAPPPRAFFETAKLQRANVEVEEWVETEGDWLSVREVRVIPDHGVLQPEKEDDTLRPGEVMRELGAEEEEDIAVKVRRKQQELAEKQAQEQQKQQNQDQGQPEELSSSRRRVNDIKAAHWAKVNAAKANKSGAAAQAEPRGGETPTPRAQTPPLSASAQRPPGHTVSPDVRAASIRGSSREGRSARSRRCSASLGREPGKESAPMRTLDAGAAASRNREFNKTFGADDVKCSTSSSFSPSSAESESKDGSDESESKQEHDGRDADASWGRGEADLEREVQRRVAVAMERERSQHDADMKTRVMFLRNQLEAKNDELEQLRCQIAADMVDRAGRTLVSPTVLAGVREKMGKLGVRETFEMMDPEDTGHITLKDLRTGFSLMGVTGNVSEEDATAMFGMLATKSIRLAEWQAFADATRDAMDPVDVTDVDAEVEIDMID